MKIWTLDFETYWDTEYSLSKMTTDGYVLDPRFEVQGLGVRTPGGMVLYFTPDRIPQVLAQIPWSEVAVLCHNTAFDGFILAHRYKTPAPKLWLDTMSMARPIVGVNVGASLAKLANHFGLPPKGKELIQTRGRRYRDFTPAEREGLARYCKHDVWLTWELLQILGEGFPKQEYALIDHTLRMFIEPVLYLDRDNLHRFRGELVERKAAMLRACGMETRDDLMSNERFATALRALEVEVPMKVSPTTGKLTYALAKKDPDFKALLEHEDERVVNLVEARLDLKSTGDLTRTDRLLLVADAGRPWPVMLNYCGADTTNRWSGGNKQNPQNLRRGGALRDSIIAPPGHVIVVADSSQIEARTNGAVAGQLDLVEGFRRGEDVYAALASEIYGYEINKKTHPLERQVGKTGILGLGYGMGAPKLQLTLKTDPIMPVLLSDEMCEHVKTVYRTKYSRIPELWKTMDHCLRLMRDGVQQDFGWFRTVFNGIVLPNGFTLRYDGLEYGEYKGERGWTYLKRGKRVRLYGAKLTENLIQALARIIVAEQMLEIFTRDMRAQFGHRLALMAHDEAVAVVPERHADAVKQLMLDKMHVPPKWGVVQIPVAAEAGYAHRYGDAK
jgi:DNA polymerase family A